MPYFHHRFILQSVPIHPPHSSSCVREAPLAETGKQYLLNCDSQPDWVGQRLLRHGEVFAFDVIAYATVGQHCHLVLRRNKAQAQAWTAQEVAERWLRLFPVPLLVRRFLRNEVLSEKERQTVLRLTAIWRRKLMDERWLVRSLNLESPVRLVPALSDSLPKRLGCSS